MDRQDLVELHYIAHLANVRSMLERGILSHVRAAQFQPVSIASEVIQARRASKRVPGAGGRPLHEYVNLYFHARNPMLYLRKDNHEDLCVLIVRPDVLDLPGIIITDSNASSDYVRFAAAPGGLAIVDRDRTYAESWTDPDQREGFRRKSAKCAEVLVPDRVASEYVTGAYVSCSTAMQRFAELKLTIQAQLDPHLFFQ